MRRINKLLSYFACVGLFVLAGAAACTPYHLTPIPFPPASELPPDQFLFVYLYDDDYTCLDGLCECAASEAPAVPFQFAGRRLRLNPYFFEPVPEDWVSLRRSTSLVVLYSDWSRRTAQMQSFSSFPIKTPVGEFRILGVNQRGDIQIRAKGKYTILPVGSEYTKQETEQRSKSCKIRHKYTLYNYGLIRDEDVEFTGADCCTP